MEDLEAKEEKMRRKWVLFIGGDGLVRLSVAHEVYPFVCLGSIYNA